jgi:hypothetical protein
LRSPPPTCLAEDFEKPRNGCVVFSTSFRENKRPRVVLPVVEGRSGVGEKR